MYGGRILVVYRKEGNPALWQAVGVARRRGASVTVLDVRRIGEGASGRNAGLVSGRAGISGSTSERSSASTSTGNRAG